MLEYWKLDIRVCDIRNDEGLRYRSEDEIMPCIVSHIFKDGGGQYCCLIMEIRDERNNNDRICGKQTPRHKGG